MTKTESSKQNANREAKENAINREVKTIDDTRAKNPGKVCNEGGWKLNELMGLLSKRLKVEPPDEYRVNDSVEKLKDLLETDSRLKNARELYEGNEIHNLSKDDLRRVIYWGLPPGAGGGKRILTMCGALRVWLEKHDLVEIDNLCGVQGKVKTGDAKEEKTRIYRIEQIVPKEQPVRFREVKDIGKLMEECFKIEKYRYDTSGKDKWIFSYLRNKLVGFIIVKGEVIIKACVAKNYRRQGIPIEVMGKLVEFAKVSTLELNNSEKDYKLILRLYKNFGFTTVSDDGKKTMMQYL